MLYLYVNRYYDMTGDHSISNDTEGNLVMLCNGCADLLQLGIQWAGRGDEECACEICGAPQEEHSTRWIKPKQERIQ